MKRLVRLTVNFKTAIITYLLYWAFQPCKIASAFGCADAKAEAISIWVGNFITDVKPYKHLHRQHINTVKHQTIGFRTMSDIVRQKYGSHFKTVCFLPLVPDHPQV